MIWLVLAVITLVVGLTLVFSRGRSAGSRRLAVGMILIVLAAVWGAVQGIGAMHGPRPGVIESPWGSNGTLTGYGLTLVFLVLLCLTVGLALLFRPPAQAGRGTPFVGAVLTVLGIAGLALIGLGHMHRNDLRMMGNAGNMMEGMLERPADGGGAPARPEPPEPAETR